MRALTVHVVDLEQEAELVRLCAMDQQVQGLQQLLQADGAAAVRVEQSEESLSEERLWRWGGDLHQDDVLHLLLYKNTLQGHVGRQGALQTGYFRLVNPS